MSSLQQITEKQVLRGLVLKIAEAAEPLGAGTEVIKAAVGKHGYGASKSDIADCCRYLEGKDLITMEKVENEVLGISRDIAHITSKGVDVLEGTETVSGIELSD